MPAISALVSGVGEGGGVCSLREESPWDLFCRLLACESTDSLREAGGDIEEVDVEEFLLFEQEAEEAAAAAAAAAARAAWVMGI